MTDCKCDEPWYPTTGIICGKCQGRLYIKVLSVDPVNFPNHYKQTSLEAIEVIDAFFKDDYYLGQVFKYIARHEHKGAPLQDLKKAQWYLNRKIKQMEVSGENKMSSMLLRNRDS